MPSINGLSGLLARRDVLYNAAGAITLALATLAIAQASAQEWTQFDMVYKDKGGRFLWTDARNWNHGVPNAEISAEVGDDNSGGAVHCVIPTGTEAECLMLELAEHGKTQGTTLRLEKEASLTVHGSAVLSKDRESWFYVDGHFRCNKERAGVRVGGPWGKPEIGEPSSCHLMIGPSGVFEAWHIGVNTNYRAAAAPSSPWGEKYWSGATGSEVVVSGGKLIAREGLRMSTTDAQLPAVLRLMGKATLEINRDSQFGFQVWCGIWEINGGQARIHVGDIEFHGNKFGRSVNKKTGKKVGTGIATLKLIGNGISTIHARNLSFVDAVELDVSKLNVRAGEYMLFNGESIDGTALKLSAATDRHRWHLRFDRKAGDVFLVVRQ